MTTKEFYDQCLENVIQEMVEHLSVKRDNTGKQYVSDFSGYEDSKEKFLERFETELDNSWDEEIEKVDPKEEEQIKSAAIETISSCYDKLYSKRVAFCKEHGIEDI